MINFKIQTKISIIVRKFMRKKSQAELQLTNASLNLFCFQIDFKMRNKIFTFNPNLNLILIMLLI